LAPPGRGLSSRPETAEHPHRPGSSGRLSRAATVMSAMHCCSPPSMVCSRSRTGGAGANPSRRASGAGQRRRARTPGRHAAGQRPARPPSSSKLRALMQTQPRARGGQRDPGDASARSRRRINSISEEVVAAAAVVVRPPSLDSLGEEQATIRSPQPLARGRPQLSVVFGFAMLRVGCCQGAAAARAAPLAAARRAAVVRLLLMAARPSSMPCRTALAVRRLMRMCR